MITDIQGLDNVGTLYNEIITSPRTAALQACPHLLTTAALRRMRSQQRKNWISPACL